MPNEATSLSFWDVSAEKSLLSENEAENMCLFCLAGSSRRSDSGCLWAGLASLRVPAPCSSIIRALHHYKLGRTSWPSLQQVRCFLAKVLKDLHGAFLLQDGPKLDAGLG